MRWPAVALRELAISDGQYGLGSPSREFRNGDPRYVRITDIRDDGRLHTGAVVAPDCEPQDWQKALLAEGDLLFARSGATVGKTYLHQTSELPAVYAGYLIRFRLDYARVFPRYVFHFTKSPAYRRWVSSSQRAVAQPNINAKQYAELPVPLPPLDEQRRLAAILDCADALRERRAATIAQFEQLADATFEAAFGDSINSPTTTLGEIADIASGMTKGRKTKEPTVPTPYLAVANVQAGRLDLAQVKEIDATQAEIGRYALASGDIVLTEGGDPDKLGRGTIWRGELPLCLHQNHIFRVRIRHDRLSPNYLSAYLASWPAKDYFLRSAKQTTGIASINMTQLRETPIYVPSHREQEHYQSRVREISEQRLTARSQATTIDELFASLQSRAFSGQL